MSERQQHAHAARSAPQRVGPFYGLALGLVLSLSPHSAESATPAQHAPPEGVVERFTLQNGLRVVLSPDPTRLTVAVTATYAVGSRDDPPDRAGLTTWIGELLTRSSANLGEPESLRLIASRGGTFGSSTGLEATQFFETLPASELPTALWLEAARLQGLGEPVASFHDQLELMLTPQDFESEGHNDGSLERLHQLVFQGSAPAAVGSAPALQRLRQTRWNQLVAFQQQHYTPSNAVLCITGAFESSAAMDLIREYFEPIPAREAATKSEYTAPAEQTSERLSVVTSINTRTPEVYLGWAIPGVDTQEHAALELATLVLADGDSSVLPKELVFHRASARRVDAWTTGLLGADLFGVTYTVAELSSVDSVQQTLDLVLKRLAWQGPSEPELKRAQARALAAFMQAWATPLQRAQMLGHGEVTRGDPTSIAQTPSRYLAVTRSEVQHAVATYLNDNRRSTVEVYPPGWPRDEIPEVVTREHLVKAGENLSVIAARYGTSTSAIARANHLDPTRPIHPGQKLVFAVNTGQKAPGCQQKPSFQSHRIQKGENLTLIAQRYKTSVDAVLKANDLKSSDRIQAGRTLQVPLPFKPCR